jgi:hypothetical protein
MIEKEKKVVVVVSLEIYQRVEQKYKKKILKREFFK